MRVAVLLLATSAACGFGAPNGNAGGDAGGTDGSTDGSTDASDIDAPPPPDAVVDANPIDDDDDDDGVLDVDDNCPLTPNANQRDHDLDARGDACDLCPHIGEGSDSDTDSDGIGNSCDPRSGPDTVALWRGFYDDDTLNGWSASGTWNIDNGRLVLETSSGNTDFIVPPTGVLTRAAVTSAVVVSSVDGNGEHMAISTGVAENQRYLCQYERQGGYSVRARVTTVDSDLGDLKNSAAVTMLTMSSVQGPTEFECRVERTGGPDIATVPMPAQTAGAVRLEAVDARPQFDYLFIVSIGN